VGLGGEAAVFPFDEQVLDFRQIGRAFAQEVLEFALGEAVGPAAGGDEPGDLGDGALGLAKAAGHVLLEDAGEALEFGFGLLEGGAVIEADQRDGGDDDQRGEQPEGQPDGRAAGASGGTCPGRLGLSAGTGATAGMMAGGLVPSTGWGA
jgi:hypothetical protein